MILTGYTSINALVKSELFPSRIRALGVGVGYALANSIFGGTAPVIYQALKERDLVPWFIGYVTVCIALSLVVYVFFLKNKAETYLDQEKVGLHPAAPPSTEGRRHRRHGLGQRASNSRIASTDNAFFATKPSAGLAATELGQILLGVGRREDHQRPVRTAMQLVGHVESAVSAEHDIEQNHVGPQFAAQLQGLLAVGRRTDDLDPAADQQPGRGAAESGAVIDDEAAHRASAYESSTPASPAPYRGGITASRKIGASSA